MLPELVEWDDDELIQKIESLILEVQETEQRRVNRELGKLPEQRRRAYEVLRDLLDDALADAE
jgi:hypothetical protein